MNQLFEIISPIEWLIGSACLLDLFLVMVLSLYLIKNFASRFSSYYCVAFAILFLALGQFLARSNTWHMLYISHIEDMEELQERFPIIGSPGYLIGTLVVSVGLVKIVHEFGKAYLSGNFWLYTIAGSILLPPIIAYFFG